MLVPLSRPTATEGPLRTPSRGSTQFLLQTLSPCLELKRLRPVRKLQNQVSGISCTWKGVRSFVGKRSSVRSLCSGAEYAWLLTL